LAVVVLVVVLVGLFVVVVVLEFPEEVAPQPGLKPELHCPATYALKSRKL